MFQIRTILNPFEATESLNAGHEVNGNPLVLYLDPQVEYVIAKNGVILDVSPENIYPVAGDVFQVIPIPRGSSPETRDIWRAVATIAVVAFAIYGGIGAFTGAGGGFKASLWAGTKAFGARMGALALVNAFLPPITSKKTESATYGWLHEENRTASIGPAMPVIYGKVNAKPVIKNRFITYDGDQQHLNVLYSFAGHQVAEDDYPVWSFILPYRRGDEVKAPSGHAYPERVYRCKAEIVREKFLSDTRYWEPIGGSAKISNIRINGNSISAFHAVKWETRPGTADQSMIPGFHATYSNFPQSRNIHTIVGPWVHDVTYRPGEIVYANEPYQRWFVCVTENKETNPFGSENWIEIAIGWSSDNAGKWSDNSFLRTMPDDFFVEAGMTAENTETIEVDMQFPYGLYRIIKDDEQFRMRADSVRVYVEYKKYGDTWENARANEQYFPKNVSDYLIHRETATSFMVPLRQDVDPGRYIIRVAVMGIKWKNGDMHDGSLLNVASITYNKYTYPGEPLLGIKALATAQLGQSIALTALIERDKVWVYNPYISEWEQKPANNHAWAVYDMLVTGCANHPDVTCTYGCKVDPGRIDYDSFAAWAAHIDDLGFTLNIIFDEFSDQWDAILRICEEGRGIVMPVGSKFVAMADKPETPSQLFTVGNTNLDTFKIQWLPRNKMANAVEVTYWDASRNHARTTFLVRSSNWDESADLNDPAQMTLYGTTNYTQAYKIAKYRLNCNEAQRMTASIEVDVDGLASQVGDVVKIQADVPQWGYGGRVVGYGEHPGNPGVFAVELDQEVEMLPGVTYEIELRHSDTDVLERKTAVYNGKYTKYIEVTENWNSEPKQYDVYAFGKQNYSTKLFRVVNIERTSDLIRTLTMLEYNESVYYDEIIPQLNISELTKYARAINLYAEEKNLVRATGEYEHTIDLTWLPPAGATWGEWVVVFRDLNDADPGWAGEYSGTETYGSGDKVVKDGKSYISLTENNASTPRG